MSDRSRILRAVGYHGTPPASRDSLARQFDHFLRAYEPVAPGDLAAFLSGEKGSSRKERLLVTFDDGLRSNYEVAAPLLEERGMRGLFFCTTGLPDAAREAMDGGRRWCAEHELCAASEPGTRIGMDWEELRELKRRGHVVGCHTASHRRMRGKPGPDIVELEIAGAKQRLEAELGSEVAHFAWVGGEPDTYDVRAQAAIRKAGFRFAYTTQSAPFRSGDDALLIHRTILDADMAYPLFRAKLAGLSDLSHARRRTAVEALLRAEGT